MEYLDIYNEKRQRTGRIIPRDGEVLAGERLLLVHACLFNSKAQMLIQKRQLSKDRYPGCWDVSAGGFVKSGEESEDCVLREIQEELGLEMSREDLRFILTEPFSYVLDDFYLAFGDYAPEKMRLQEEEVSEVKWAGWPEIKEMLTDGRFVDYDMGLMERIFTLAGAI